MKAVLYFKKPFDSGAVFPISVAEIASIMCLEGASGVRGPMTKRKSFAIKNIAIVADEQLERIALKDPEKFDSFEEFLWSICGELRLTHNM